MLKSDAYAVGILLFFVMSLLVALDFLISLRTGKPVTPGNFVSDFLIACLSAKIGWTVYAIFKARSS